MSQSRPAMYEIRIAAVSARASVRPSRSYEVIDVPAETLVRGAVLDQAGLHGMLDRLRTYGYELVEVRRVGEL